MPLGSSYLEKLAPESPSPNVLINECDKPRWRQRTSPTADRRINILQAGILIANCFVVMKGRQAIRPLKFAFSSESSSLQGARPTYSRLLAANLGDPFVVTRPLGFHSQVHTLKSKVMLYRTRYPLNDRTIAWPAARAGYTCTVSW